MRGLLLGTLLLFGCGAGVWWSVPTREISAASRAVAEMKGASNGVHFLSSGREDAAVTFFFVHGTPGDAGNWGAFLTDENLQKDFKLVAFDRLGFGKSQESGATPQLAVQSEALVKAASLVRGKKIWVGHSYGVPVIARLAADHPKLVDGAVLIAGPAGPQYVKKTWYQSLAATGVGQAVISRNLKTANVEMIALEAELEKLQPAWEQMHFPITVIHAEDDVLAKFGNVDFLKEHLPSKSLRFVELKKGNHFLIWSHRDLVVTEMRTLVEELGR